MTEGLDRHGGRVRSARSVAQGGNEVVRSPSSWRRIVVDWRAWRSAAVAFLVWAFLIQWGWEAVHAAAYVETAGPLRQRLWCCLPMGAVDAVWSLGLVITARVIVRPAGQSHRAAFFWLTAVLGATTATILEWHALRTGRWTYNALMPLIPGLGVGVFPVLQMAIVPVVAARFSGFLLAKWNTGGRADGSG